MKTEFTIQQVARQTGLSLDTLRYYERIGLIEPINRAQNGHRRYTQEDVNWIGLLIRLRATGMPIAQMVRFAQLRLQGSRPLLSAVSCSKNIRTRWSSAYSILSSTWLCYNKK